MPLQIGVLGAGAIGCYLGGWLARLGHAVTLVGRPRIVETTCDGCGQCVQVCPAPRPALRFVARESA